MEEQVVEEEALGLVEGLEEVDMVGALLPLGINKCGLLHRGLVKRVGRVCSITSYTSSSCACVVVQLIMLRFGRVPYPLPRRPSLCCFLWPML